ncbi:MAG: GPW/gp25 family protein [Paludibacteraceae bacterium]|nr:GPW/gp25 family protein [Prevotellaceae bacterium]
MEGRYYKIPLDFGALLDETHGSVDLCSELESVDQHIELLVMTYPGEHVFDRTYGTGIWEMDFERIVSLDAWKTKFAECLARAVGLYEKRISDCRFRLEVEDVLIENGMVNHVSVKKRVDVFVDAVLNSTGDRCRLHYTLYLGPLSKD